jgi:4-oxalocrotonate tautomerase
MPLVQISMLPGRSAAQKRGLLREVTDAVVRNCKVPADAVRVLITEIEPEHWSVAGLSKADSDAKNKKT